MMDTVFCLMLLWTLFRSGLRSWGSMSFAFARNLDSSSHGVRTSNLGGTDVEVLPARFLVAAVMPVTIPHVGRVTHLCSSCMYDAVMLPSCRFQGNTPDPTLSQLPQSKRSLLNSIKGPAKKATLC